MAMAKTIATILHGLLAGILGMMILIYVLRPKQPYPKWMLLPFHHPWMFIIILIVWYFIFQWDVTVGVLLAFFFIAISLDIYLLGISYSPSNTQTTQHIQDDTNTWTMPSTPLWGEPLNMSSTSHWIQEHPFASYLYYSMHPDEQNGRITLKSGEPMPVPNNNINIS
jgi:hypothetical protein